MEAYVNGVSTRKVDRLVEQLGISAMSKDRVSALCRSLDERVEAFRERPLEGEFPYLWLDAKQLKVRSGGHVRSKALVVAYAVHESGRREVIGIDMGEVESEAFWVEFLRGLRARGLAGVRLAISDHHEGLKTAIAQILACPWQRCTVHFVRNMHGHCRRSERGLVSAALREIFAAESLEEAKARLGEVLERFREPLGKVAELLEGEAALDQPPGATQQGDRAQIRRRRDLPQRCRRAAAHRRAADRAERRVARLQALPLRGVARPGPRGPGR
jgi:transposase-like protein